MHITSIAEETSAVGLFFVVSLLWFFWRNKCCVCCWSFVVLLKKQALRFSFVFFGSFEETWTAFFFCLLWFFWRSRDCVYFLSFVVLLKKQALFVFRLLWLFFLHGLTDCKYMYIWKYNVVQPMCGPVYEHFCGGGQVIWLTVETMSVILCQWDCLTLTVETVSNIFFKVFVGSVVHGCVVWVVVALGRYRQPGASQWNTAVNSTVKHSCKQHSETQLSTA